MQVYDFEIFETLDLPEASEPAEVVQSQLNSVPHSPLLAGNAEASAFQDIIL